MSNKPEVNVSLIMHAGGDISVVNAARVSFGKQVISMRDEDEKLIHFLMKNRHTSPFEHNLFSFRVKSPIFVAREWFRHRIGAFNEHSQRYSEVNMGFYEVPYYDLRTQVGKPGHYVMEPMKEPSARRANNAFQQIQKDAHTEYRYLIKLGLAKEVARNVLPMSTYTEFIWTVNAHSLMNFLSLRTSPQALREIRYFAEAVELIFKQEMPVTYAAWKQAMRDKEEFEQWKANQQTSNTEKN